MKNEGQTVLDCTFRDGGYYNDWKFPSALVRSTGNFLAHVGVNFWEVGFRRAPVSASDEGPLRTTSDDYLISNLPENSPEIAVMINAADFPESDGEATLVRAFPNARKNSPVSLVRIASHYEELDSAMKIGEKLKGLGFKIGLNLMGASTLDSGRLTNFASIAKRLDADFTYLADSYGSLTVYRTVSLFEKLRNEGVSRLGIHAHDNLGLATSITSHLLKSGLAEIGDATIRGIGRGAGNARLEDLLIDLGRSGEEVASAVQFSQSHFLPLQHRYKWGASSAYRLSALGEVHPSYNQELEESNSYTQPELLRVIAALAAVGARKYRRNAATSGSWLAAHTVPAKDLIPEASGSPLIILGSGTPSELELEQIQEFTIRRKPRVVKLNTAPGYEKVKASFHAVTNPYRLVADSEFYIFSGATLVSPIAQIPDPFKKRVLSDCNLFDYPLSIEEKIFGMQDGSVRAPDASTLAYALGLAAGLGFDSIFLAGLTGYGAGDPRGTNSLRTLNAFKAKNPSAGIYSFTPNSYGIEMSTSSA